MRLAFVTSRFGAVDASFPERLAAELARRAPDRWRTTVLTTTAGATGETPFEEGRTRDERSRIHRFAANLPESASAGAKAVSAGGTPPDRLTAPALLAHLSERGEDYDLIAIFGARPLLCREAVRIAPARTVLLPCGDEAEPDDPGVGDAFEHPAAFVFGSEAEEVRVLKRYPVDRRMRETVGADLMLPRTADSAAFRRRHGLAGRHLIHAGPVEPGRGIEEFLRFFAAFRDRRRDAALDLVLFGPASIRLPRRPDIRLLDSPGAKERLDAIAGALMAVIPERLAGFGAAAEPFSLGVPILVNASAAGLVEDCQASNGGLYYQNYEELELILELGLRNPSLLDRLGAAGREFLRSRNDWDAVMARYDRAFRSFARPPRSQPSPRAAAAPATNRPGEPEARGAGDRNFAGAGPSSGSAGLPAAEAADTDAGGAPPTERSGDQRDRSPQREDDGREAADPTARSATAARSGPADPDETAAEGESPGGVAEPPTDAPEAETGDPSLPRFFQGSIRG